METLNRIIALILGIIFLAVVIFLFMNNRAKQQKTVTTTTVTTVESPTITPVATISPTKKPSFLESLRAKLIPGYGATPTLTPTPALEGGATLPDGTVATVTPTMGQYRVVYPSTTTTSPAVTTVPKTGPELGYLASIVGALVAGAWLKRSR